MVRAGGLVLLRRNRFRFAEFTGQEQHFLSINYDYRAQAQTAMRWAKAATCERERQSWLRVALAWQDLDRGDEDAAISDRIGCICIAVP